ncbi:TolC family protein, partial [bacterium]|nr:TolC family protein [bacterium]
NITFEDAIAIANDSRPDLKNAQILVEQSRQNLKLAKKTFFPVIDAQGQYQRGGKHWTSNDGFNIGLFLNFNNLNAALINNQIKEARYTYDKQLALAQKIQNDVYLDIQNSFLTLNEKSNQIPVALIQLQHAQENYDLSFGRYRVGEASPIELREAENTLRNAKLTYFASLFEYNSARAELERSIGRNIGNTNEVIELNK